MGGDIERAGHSLVCPFGFPWALGSGCCDLFEELLPLLQKEEGLWGLPDTPVKVPQTAVAGHHGPCGPFGGGGCGELEWGDHVFPDILSHCRSLGSVLCSETHRPTLRVATCFFKSSSLTILENRRVYLIKLTCSETKT